MAAQNAEMTSSTMDLTACVKEQDKILMAQAKVFKLDLFKNHLIFKSFEINRTKVILISISFHYWVMLS